MHCCPNLEILTWIGGELSLGQAQNWVKFNFQLKLDLEGQGQSTPLQNKDLNQGFCTSDPNLVILAWTGDELSYRQACDWYTDTGNDNTLRPKHLMLIFS